MAVRDTLTVLQQEMVMVEVEFHMVPSSGNGHYQNPPGGEHNGNHCAAGSGDGGLADDLYGTGSKISLSSEPA